MTERHRLPFDAHLIRVILPWRSPVRILAVAGEFEPPHPGQTPGLRMLIYGSSITQGYTSIRPGSAYAFRTAQLLGYDLINLGFGAGAQLEPQMASFIASRHDWHAAVLESGINLRLVYLDGHALLPSVTGLMADLIHPSPTGMEELAQNLSTALKRSMNTR